MSSDSHFDEKGLVVLVEAKDGKILQILHVDQVVDVLMNLDVSMITPEMISGLEFIVSDDTFKGLVETIGEGKALVLRDIGKMLLGNNLMQLPVKSEEQRSHNVSQGSKLLLSLFVNDKSERAFNCMLQNLLKLGYYDDAINHIEKYVDIAPKICSRHLLRGFFMEDNKNLNIEKIVSLITSICNNDKFVKDTLNEMECQDGDATSFAVTMIATLITYAYSSKVELDVKNHLMKYIFEKIPENNRIKGLFFLAPSVHDSKAMFKDMTDAKIFVENTKEYLYARLIIDANVTDFMKLYGMCESKTDKKIVYELYDRVEDMFDQSDPSHVQFLENISKHNH